MSEYFGKLCIPCDPGSIRVIPAPQTELGELTLKDHVEVVQYHCIGCRYPKQWEGLLNNRIPLDTASWFAEVTRDGYLFLDILPKHPPLPIGSADLEIYQEVVQLIGREKVG